MSQLCTYYMGGLGVAITVGDYGVAVMVPENEDEDARNQDTVPVPMRNEYHYYDDDIDDEQWRDENLVPAEWVT
jgi:hypothetical protein